MKVWRKSSAMIAALCCSFGVSAESLPDCGMTLAVLQEGRAVIKEQLDKVPPTIVSDGIKQPNRLYEALMFGYVQTMAQLKATEQECIRS